MLGAHEIGYEPCTAVHTYINTGKHSVSYSWCAALIAADLEITPDCGWYCTSPNPGQEKRGGAPPNEKRGAINARAPASMASIFHIHLDVETPEVLVVVELLRRGELSP